MPPEQHDEPAAELQALHREYYEQATALARGYLSGDPAKTRAAWDALALWALRRGAHLKAPPTPYEVRYGTGRLAKVRGIYQRGTDKRLAVFNANSAELQDLLQPILDGKIE